MVTAELHDGRKLEFPDGTDPAVVQATVKKVLGASAAPARPQWSELPGNIPKSAGNLIGGLYDAVTSPVQTLKGLTDIGAGALRNAVPAGIRTAIDALDSPQGQQAAQRASGTASAVGNFYRDRYGSLEGARNALITDPVGVAADASTVLGGGAGLAGRVGMAKTASALDTVSRAVNPLSAVAPVVRGTAKAVGAVAKPVLGLATGAGGEAIGQAFQAGKRGNTDFMANISGEASQADVVGKLKAGIADMQRAKTAEYRANMAGVSKDKTVLSFADVDSAIGDAMQMASFKGQVKNPRAAAAVQKAADDVAEWKALDPAQYHTPEGLDALKQRIGATLEGIPFEEVSARSAVNKIYNAAKSTIVKQAPDYANTMKAYTEASEQITEIERALSAGKKASADTALRKLQSVMRNNANTNYGSRIDAVRAVEQASGADMMPAIAGQALNSWTPRSLSGQGAGLATMGGVVAGNPALLGLLPFQSPRAVGLASYGAGRTAGALGQARNALMLTPEDLAVYWLGAAQLGNLPNR